jgi:glyoxylase-like metal-dependent hydrolase (beta-lactamase superfamily II)
MKIFKIETPAIKLDGGALFGVIPKWMWQNKYPADENNLCICAVRSLLISDNDKLILIDTGVGTKHKTDDLAYDFVDADNDLEKGIIDCGFSLSDVTDVILTHLHFDHCGGAIKINQNTNKHEYTFPNAKYHISESQWNEALNPNYREKASFLTENIELLINSDKLNLIKTNSKLIDNINLEIYHGHTKGLLVPIINYNGKEIAFPGDLLPIKALIPLAWISAYDVRPLDVVEEKKKFLEESFNKNRIIIFQHDYYNECCDLQKTQKGIRANNTFKISEIS